MGCSLSTPLQKTYTISPNYQSNQSPNSFSPRSESSQKPTTQGFIVDPTANVIQDEQGDDGIPIRPFFSFLTFMHQAENPQIFEWIFKKEIGKGAMSRVFLAKHAETGELCAAKEYNKGLLIRQTLGNEDPPYLAVQKEIEIMASISHRYVLPIIEVIDDDFSNSLILMIPYAEKGTLQSRIDAGPIPEEVLAVCFHQIAEALRCVHSNNIVHRDLKPENILVFSDTLFCLSDFSVSTQLSDPNEMLLDTRGSPAFLSPEECGGDPFYPKMADVWAYGVSLYCAAFRCLPFRLDQGQGKTVANTVYAVTHLLSTEELQFPENNNASPMLLDLISRILVKDPLKRPTMEEIVLDPWFDNARKIDEANIEAEAKLHAKEEYKIEN